MGFNKNIKLLLLILIINLVTYSQINQREVDSLIKISNSNLPDSIRIIALSDLNWMFSISNPKKSKEYALQEINLAKKGPPLFLAQGYNDLAISYYRLTINDSALFYNKKAYEIRKSVGRKDLMASSLSKMSNIYSDLGDYSKALILNLEALNIYEQKKDEQKLALIYNNIGQTYNKLNRIDKEIEYTEKALVLCKKMGDEYGEANCLVNLAGCYVKTGRQKKVAFEMMDNVIAIYIKLNDSLNLSSAYNNMGYFCRLVGKNEEGKIYYLKAIEICKKINNIQSLLLYLHNLSSIQLLEKNYLEAEKTSKEVLELTSPENID